jgi:lipoprotein-anchoring transpeptidase ErfK/SrfK
VSAWLVPAAYGGGTDHLRHATGRVRALFGLFSIGIAYQGDVPIVPMQWSMMPTAHVQVIRIVALGAVAVALAFVLLAVDRDRRAYAGVQTAAGAPIARMDATRPAPRTEAMQPAAAAPAGQLVAGPGQPAPAPTQPTAPVTAPVLKRGGVACGQPHRVVEINRNMSARVTPGGREIGVLPARSKYLGSSIQAWVQAVSADGAWGKVTIPWSRPVNRAAWVPLRGAAQHTTRVMVVGDVSERTLRVYRGCALQFAAPMAVGAAGSPSPLGRFWVTDRVAVPRSQPYFGSYAFGLSTIQPHPPAGWTGGNRMAIHGTNAPSTIGTAASAGCLRVGERTLTRLRAIAGIGTPVIIQR